MANYGYWIAKNSAPQHGAHIPQIVVFQIEFSDFEAILARLVDIARSMTVIFDKNWGKLA
jgi:hypothetical protein